MACITYSKGNSGNYKDGEMMAVLIKDKKKPPKCEWVDKHHDLHRCVMLDGEDNCVLQDCAEGTWSEQYANCPLVEVDSDNLVDADRVIHTKVYAVELEGVIDRSMTIADFLDEYTEEGCPMSVMDVEE